ncbi:ankyrin repeat-containing domain, PGG domain protein, partial [Tanacetum coccineum]
MGASSSNSSFIAKIGEDPNSSHVCSPNVITVKLSGRDTYDAWKTHMLCLLVRHNMLGYIKGKVARPKEYVKTKLARDIEAWVRSDLIVKSWILGSISEQVTMYVVDRLIYKFPNADFAAKDVWDELQCIYGPEMFQQAS